MIAEVATNLLGEIVEIYEWSDNYSDDKPRDAYSLRGRGTVRAVYVTDGALMVLVEHNLDWASRMAYIETDRTKDGGLEAYSLHKGRARVVQQCGQCLHWDQKSMLMAVYPGEGLEKAWEHKGGEGCKKAGSGG